MTAETPNRDPSLIHILRAMDDENIRSYREIQLLETLVQGQAKGFIDQIFVLAGIGASIVIGFAYVQDPASRVAIYIVYPIIVAILVLGLFLQRRSLSHSHEMGEMAHLGMYLDQVGKFLREIDLAEELGSDDGKMSEFIGDTKDALNGILPDLAQHVKELRANKDYPKCLENFGRGEEWVNKLDARVRVRIGRGFLD